jgi:hypothetical protein
MQSETLACSVLVWSSQVLVRSLPILECSPQRPSIQTQRLAPWVVHWLVQNYSQAIHWQLVVVLCLAF